MHYATVALVTLGRCISTLCDERGSVVAFLKDVCEIAASVGRNRGVVAGLSPVEPTMMLGAAFCELEATLRWSVSVGEQILPRRN